MDQHEDGSSTANENETATCERGSNNNNSRLRADELRQELAETLENL